MLSPAERLTLDFYRWEQRGRGWRIWDYPVELEPVFIPFYFHDIPFQPAVDDGRRPTLFSDIYDWVANGFHKKRAESLSPIDEKPVEAEPDLAPLTGPLVEVPVLLPADAKVELETVESLLLGLSYCSNLLSFEVVGTAGSVSVQFAADEPDLPLLQQQLQAHWPEAAVSAEGGALNNRWRLWLENTIIEFGLAQEFMRPLRSLKNLQTDPLIGITAAMENLEGYDLALFQVLFQAVRHPWADSIIRSVTDWKGDCFFADAPEMTALARAKTRRPLFAAVVRIACQSSEPWRAEQVVKAMAGALTQFSDPMSNELIPLTNEDYAEKDHNEDVYMRQSHRSGMLLNSEELASIVHPPSVAVRSNRLQRQVQKTKTAPVIANNHPCILGENIHHGKVTTVTLSSEQRLRHLHIIGATGSGKSTLLLNLAVQDMKAGSGVAVLDPHGDLIDQALAYVPGNRSDDVILFDPADAEHPVGLNILNARSEIEKNVLASDLVSVFRRLSTSWGDQMTSVLGNAILAFLESDQGGTLSDLRHFLIENDYRKSYLETVTDPEVVYYWRKEFPLLSGRPQASILTRLDTFLRPRLIRNIVTQKEGLDFERILKEHKILLVKLAQGLIGEENSYLLGALIVSKLQQAVTSRQGQELTEHDNYYLYIDEFHNFVTPSLAAILSGARKYRLGLILAHQELRQLVNRDPEVAASVIANPYTRVCFRLGDYDAQKLESGFASFDAKDLQNLGIGEAIVRIERPDYDFNLKVQPPQALSGDEAHQRMEALISLSRARYGGLITGETSVKTLKPIKETPQTLEPAAPSVQEPVEDRERNISQHRYLQSLIKRLGEERGFRATVEQTTLDGQGRVDVALESEGGRIAFEVSITSSPEHELHNIKKCLDAEFDQVILCSPNKHTLNRVKALTTDKLTDAEQERISFLTPDEVVSFLAEAAPTPASSTELVRGHRVNVSYTPIQATVQKTKRETNIILKALGRLKGDR